MTGTFMRADEIREGDLIDVVLRNGCEIAEPIRVSCAVVYRGSDSVLDGGTIAAYTPDVSIRGTRGEHVLVKCHTKIRIVDEINSESVR